MRTDGSSEPTGTPSDALPHETSDKPGPSSRMPSTGASSHKKKATEGSAKASARENTGRSTSGDSSPQKERLRKYLTGSRLRYTGGKWQAKRKCDRHLAILTEYLWLEMERHGL